MEPPDLPEFMDPERAARFMGISVDTVYRLCRARLIRHRRVGACGGRILMTRQDCRDYLDSCVVEPQFPAKAPNPLSVSIPAVARLDQEQLAQARNIMRKAMARLRS